MSRFDPDKATRTAPVRVFDGDEIAKDYTCENCLLFQPKNGPLMLFVLVGGAAYKKPGDNTIYYHNLRGYLKTSSDDGRTWSPPKALGDSADLEGGHLIGPTKNAPIQLDDGTILVGSSSEYGLLESRNWGAITYHFEKSIDNGKAWQFVFKCAKAAHLAVSHTMQPGFLRLGDGRLCVIYNTNLARWRGLGSQAVMVLLTRYHRQTPHATAISAIRMLLVIGVSLYAKEPS